MGLTSVLFPEGKEIAVPISGTQRAPAAKISAWVRHAGGQSSVTMTQKALQPAVLFGGDFVVYVAWAVAPNGLVENLGGFANSGESRMAYKTGVRDFALMITAEPIIGVRTPGELVVFFCGTPSVKGLKLTAFTYGGLSDRQGVITGERDSIAGMTYKVNKAKPLALIQAEKAVELLDRFDARSFDSSGYDNAMTAIAEAREAKGRKQTDACSHAVEFASQALLKTVKMMEAQKEAEAAARSVAERQAFAGRTTSLQSELETTKAKLAKTEASLATARETLRASESEATKLENQRQQMYNRLEGAMGALATSAKTERGYTISLSGTAFDSGKSSLSTAAKYVLAKLSGIMLAMPNTRLSVEGHTDSTGGEELNRKLSQARADSVKDFLSEMGVTPSIMVARGFGPDRPIAPNDTPMGQAKNRRVDIVLLNR
jgi:outer membrane protein OmpA-like peptidoglycan-associated protein